MRDQQGTPRIPWIHERRCRTCPTCEARAACRTKAMMYIDPGEAPFIDPARCQGCRVCLPACPFGAIVV